MIRWVEWLARRRALAVGVALAVALCVGAFGLRLEIDNSLSAWFVEGDPALRAYEAFLQTFGSDEVVVTALQGEGTVYTPQRLTRLLDLSRALEAIPGVARVWSLAALRVPLPGPDGVAWVPLLETPVTPQAAQNARRAVAQSPLAARLVGADGQTLAVYTWLAQTPELERARGEILDAVRAAVEAHLVLGERAHHGGVGVVYDALNRATFGEGAAFIGLSYLVVAAVLWAVTGRWLWTALALAVVSLADAVMFGALGMLSRSLNLVTMALPALVIVLGVAHVLHMSAHVEGAARPARALARVTVPCAFNALTTAGGFLSLTTAGMAITRDYGLFAAVGVLAAFFLALVGVAAVLPWSGAARASGLKRVLARGMGRAVGVALARRGMCMAVAVGVLALALWGTSRIEIDTRTLDFLPDASPARADHAVLERVLGPYLPLELVVALPAGSGWRDPEVQAALAQASAALQQLPGVGGAASVADAVAALGIALPALDPARFPELRHWVSDDGRQLRLTASVPMASAKALTALSVSAVAAAQGQLGARGVVTASGYLPLYSRIVDHLLGDQVTSFAWAFAVVFGLVGLVLRDVRLTLLAVPTNVLPVLIVLGVMGWVGIRLDVATVTIAAAVLGIVVDDTLHMLYALKRRLRAGVSLEEAFAQIAHGGGVAIASTSAVFVLGFGVIAFAGVKSVAYVGLLTATAVAAAFVVDVFLLPALAAYVLGRGVSQLTR